MVKKELLNMMHIIQFKYLYFFLALLCFSCSENNFNPKPKGYNRIDLPKPTYKILNEAHPYTFEYSSQAVVLKDTFARAEKDWIFVYYPQFKATIEITYKDLKLKPKAFQELVNDSYKMASKHQVKAESIEETVITTPKNYTATLFRLTGQVPSQFQFFVSDSTSNFFRGALYFRTATQNDSLAPVIEYVKKDMLHMVNSLEWKKMK